MILYTDSLNSPAGALATRHTVVRIIKSNGLI